MSMFNSPLPPPGSVALLLARYSSNLQNPMSADDQIEVLRKDCERLGWQIGGVFKDEAKSGRSVAKRAGYLDMMAAAEAGDVDVICVFHLDRLGRNSRELHDAKNRLKDVNAVIYTHDRGVMNRLEFALYAEMAQMESERIADRTTRGRRAAAARGKFMGDIPYGYRSVDEVDARGQPVLNSRGNRVRRIEIDPEQAAVVRRANLDFDAGLSPHQIAIALSAEGVPTPEGGKLWSPNSIIGTKRSMCGLLRNPLYVGRMIHGKVQTTLDERTGQIKKRRGEVADQIEYDMPWLRILPQEVWDRTQARLEQRPPSKLIGHRRPTYLLSGLVRCGVCGGSFVQVTTKMGCTARHLKACSNSRRVRREDLERVVLGGLVQRLKEPTVVQWFIPEYLRERAPAQTQHDDRFDRAVKRLAEVGQEIENLLHQVRAGAQGYAAQLLNENLGTLGAEKERLGRQVRAGPPVKAAALTTAELTNRMHDLFEDLGGALEGDERDAARARDIIRSLITQVTVTPFDGYGGRPDGRGNGAVRVEVEGEVSRLVDHALLDRKIMHVRSAGDMHGLPIATFRFTVDLDRTQSPEQEGVWRDAALIGRLLDDAGWPVSFREMIDAVNDRGRPTDAGEAEIDETRARIALAQFRRDGWVRSIVLGLHERGWVWNDRDVSDDEWREEYARRAEIDPPIGIIRLGAPDAAVIVIGERKSKPTQEGKRT
jgi:DNA invertase Pin-like site-specific DNA recombinase